jgi:hypothetical protein
MTNAMQDLHDGVTARKRVDAAGVNSAQESRRLIRRLAKWFRRTITSLRGCELPYKRKQGHRFYG